MSYECQRVSLISPSLVLDPSGSSLKDLQWPSNELRDFVQRDVAWQPSEGLEFEIVYKFDKPRSEVKHRNEEPGTVLLLKSNDKYLLIPESGVKYLPDLFI